MSKGVSNVRAGGLLPRLVAPTHRSAIPKPNLEQRRRFHNPQFDIHRLPPVEHGDPCEETTLASIGKPLLDHLDGSNAIEALPVGNRLLHQLERIISHTVIVDQVVALSTAPLASVVQAACISQAVEAAATRNSSEPLE